MALDKKEKERLKAEIEKRFRLNIIINAAKQECINQFDDAQKANNERIQILVEKLAENSRRRN
jgi:hypothetical protein